MSRTEKIELLADFLWAYFPTMDREESHQLATRIVALMGIK